MTNLNLSKALAAIESADQLLTAAKKKKKAAKKAPAKKKARKSKKTPAQKRGTKKKTAKKKAAKKTPAKRKAVKKTATKALPRSKKTTKAPKQAKKRPAQKKGKKDASNKKVKGSKVRAAGGLTHNVIIKQQCANPLKGGPAIFEIDRRPGGILGVIRQGESEALVTKLLDVNALLDDSLDHGYTGIQGGPIAVLVTRAQGNRGAFTLNPKGKRALSSAKLSASQKKALSKYRKLSASQKEALKAYAEAPNLRKLSRSVKASAMSEQKVVAAIEEALRLRKLNRRMASIIAVTIGDALFVGGNNG